MIDGYTRTCGLIGNPVEHTLSPLIHNMLAKETGVNLVYVPFHVETGRVGEAVKGAYALNLLGCNVTVPYKSEVLPFLKEIDPLAKSIGAVNTLVREEGGYKGYNTDMPGLYRAFVRDHVKIRDEKVLILGAGGVARAVAMLLWEKKAERIVILNRSLEKAKEIAEEINALAGEEKVEVCSLAEYESLAKDGPYLVIQATSVGMYPKCDEAVIEEESFYKMVHTGYDLIFNPPETRFMSLTKKAGGRAFNGARMLLYQGIIAYELWTGKEIAEELADRVFLEMKHRKENIVLTGFMGSGKSTVGRRLSYLLKKPYLDTDKLIEQRQKKTISEIFKEEGEDAFRTMETELLEELAQAKCIRVISVGGGTPLREQNRVLLSRLGKVVYLRIRPETVYERLKEDKTRPLLQCEDPLTRIRELIASRNKAYEERADLIIDVDELNTEEVAKRIMKEEGL